MRHLSLPGLAKQNKEKKIKTYKKIRQDRRLSSDHLNSNNRRRGAGGITPVQNCEQRSNSG